MHNTPTNPDEQGTEPQPPRTRAVVAGTWALLIFMAVTVVWGTVAWVDASTFWPTGDSKFHLENLWAAHHQLRDHEWLGLPIARYSPGFYVFTDLLFWLFGDSLAVAALAQALCAAALLVLSYLIGAGARDRTTGLLAAAMLFTSLTVADATRQYFLDLPSAVPMALVLLALVRDPDLSKWRWALLAGLGVAGVLITRTGTLPLLIPAMLVCLVQASSRHRHLSLGILLGLGAATALALSTLDPTTWNRQLVQATRRLASHAGALGVAVPILGLAMLLGGLWAKIRAPWADRPRARASSWAFIVAGISAAALGNLLCSRLDLYAGYMEIAVFTGGRPALGTHLPQVLSSLGDMMVSGPVALLALVGAAVGAVQWQDRTLRTLSLGALLGLAFLVVVTDQWLRYTTPLLVPVLVLAATPLARLPVARWLALGWLVVQGTGLWLGWTVWDHAGIELSHYREQPVLSVRPPQHFGFTPWGYLGQRSPLFTIPVYRKPWVAQAWYEQLDERGHLRPGCTLAMGHTIQRGQDELSEMRFLLTRHRHDVAVAELDPDHPMAETACLSVSIRETPAGEQRDGEERVRRQLAWLSAADDLALVDSFEVDGGRTTVWTRQLRDPSEQP